ncbi:MAG: hypothetical protein L0227_05480 [Chloroflexi bacterium]|nr:hypothetical protein [Chloroflexota bacterium]
MATRRAAWGNVNVFVVRVWSGDDAAPEAAPELHAGLGDRVLRGVVHHVRSGSETTFVSPGELLAFLAAPAAECTPDVGAAGTHRRTVTAPR